MRKHPGGQVAWVELSPTEKCRLRRVHAKSHHPPTTQEWSSNIVWVCICLIQSTGKSHGICQYSKEVSSNSARTLLNRCTVRSNPPF